MVRIWMSSIVLIKHEWPITECRCAVFVTWTEGAGNLVFSANRFSEEGVNEAFTEFYLALTFEPGFRLFSKKCTVSRSKACEWDSIGSAWPGVRWKRRFPLSKRCIGVSLLLHGRTGPVSRLGAKGTNLAPPMNSRPVTTRCFCGTKVDVLVGSGPGRPSPQQYRSPMFRTFFSYPDDGGLACEGTWDFVFRIFLSPKNSVFSICPQSWHPNGLVFFYY